jgi:murein DD-endopeptidase MepM/ murein hydrolase activator NlpD
LAGADAGGASPAHRRRGSATGKSPDSAFARKLLAGLGLLGLAVLLAVFGIRLLKPSFPVPAEGLLPAADSLPASDFGGESLLLDFISPDLSSPADPADIAGLPLPRALELSTYTVQKGDSIGSIAKRFGRSVDSLLSLNGIKNVKGLRTGTELRIPNMDGLIHVVAKGENLGLIAKRYKVELTLIADANDLGSTSIRVGQSLFIPGARLAPEELRRIYGTSFAWPLRGPISSRFGVRSDPFTGVRRFHAGVDIVVDLGTPVRAAAAGRVADLGYNANYGNYIILSHGDGLQTLYGHLSGFTVTIGQTVAQGAVIGKSGNTGYSTGPHLHFGIYRGGAAVDPFKMLK